MVLLDELRVTMSDYRKDLKELYEVLGIEKAQARYDALQKQVADPDFYSDLENSQKVLQEVKSLENRIEKYQKMEETLDDILTLIELTMEEGEEESNAELNEEADKFVKELESLKLASLLTGEYDSSNAILTFHAGAGGTEAQDWAEMLSILRCQYLSDIFEEQRQQIVLHRGDMKIFSVQTDLVSLQVNG